MAITHERMMKASEQDYEQDEGEDEHLDRRDNESSSARSKDQDIKKVCHLLEELRDDPEDRFTNSQGGINTEGQDHVNRIMDIAEPHMHLMHDGNERCLMMGDSVDVVARLRDDRQKRRWRNARWSPGQEWTSQGNHWGRERSSFQVSAQVSCVQVTAHVSAISVSAAAAAAAIYVSEVQQQDRTCEQHEMTSIEEEDEDETPRTLEETQRTKEESPRTLEFLAPPVERKSPSPDWDGPG